MNEKLNPMQRAMVEYAVRNFNTDLLTAKEVKVLIQEGLWGKEIHNWMTAEGYRFKEGNRWIHRIPTELLENG